MQPSLAAQCPLALSLHIHAGLREEGHFAQSTPPAGHGFPWEFSHQLLTQPGHA